MQNIRSFFVVMTAIAALAVAALLTASLTVAFVGTLALLSLGRAFSQRLKPVPVRAKATREDMRVWNDGRGTIIDM
jgi:membrane protein implicated in regulation of membrane protease activity